MNGWIMTQTADGESFFKDIAGQVESLCGTADCHEGDMINFELMYELNEMIIDLAVKHGLREPRKAIEPIAPGEIPF